MKMGLYIITVGAVALVLGSAHFGIRAYMRSQRLQVETEVLAVRTRTLRHQLGELEQKLRVMDRVRNFVDRAADEGMLAEQWSEYAVNIQDPLSFDELGRIVEQCGHSKDLYFKPISFHVAVGQNGDELDAAIPNAKQAANASLEDSAADVILGLKGAFMVRH